MEAIYHEYYFIFDWLEEPKREWPMRLNIYIVEDIYKLAYTHIFVVRIYLTISHRMEIGGNRPQISNTYDFFLCHMMMEIGIFCNFLDQNITSTRIVVLFGCALGGIIE